MLSKRVVSVEKGQLEKNRPVRDFALQRAMKVYATGTTIPSKGSNSFHQRSRASSKARVRSFTHAPHQYTSFLTAFLTPTTLQNGSRTSVVAYFAI